MCAEFMQGGRAFTVVLGTTHHTKEQKKKNMYWVKVLFLLDL